MTEDFFDDQELREMAEEAHQLGWSLDRYLGCLKCMARPDTSKEGIERARIKAQEIVAADRAAAEAKKQSQGKKEA